MRMFRRVGKARLGAAEPESTARDGSGRPDPPEHGDYCEESDPLFRGLGWDLLTAPVVLFVLWIIPLAAPITWKELLRCPFPPLP